MPTDGIKLCNACRQREATCHVNEITAGGIRSTDLCAECYEAREPTQQKRLRQAAQTARCRYCGGGPCVEWNSLTNLFGAIVTDGEPAGLLCARCTGEYNRFLAREMEDLPRGLSGAEEGVIARRLRERAEQHLREWVAQRT